MSGPGVVEAWILIPHMDGVCTSIGIFFAPEGIPVPAGPGDSPSENHPEKPAPTRCCIVRISCSVYVNDFRMTMSTAVLPAGAERRE